MSMLESATTRMNCLVCGHKLAIFRKLSLGDFCCQEHRALFVQEQGEPAVAPLTDPGAGVGTKAPGTRVYAQFLVEELSAVEDAPGYYGHGPLAPPPVYSPQTPLKSFAQLAQAKPSAWIAPQRGDTSTLGFGVMSPAL